MNFDLLTPSPGSGEVGEGGRRGEIQQFFPLCQGIPHFTVQTCPISPQTTNPPNHQESIKVRIRGDCIFFRSICDVLRFSYEIGKKQLQIFVGFGLSAEFTTMYKY